MTHIPIIEAGSRKAICVPAAEQGNDSPFKAAKRLASMKEKRCFTNGQALRFFAEFYINQVQPDYLDEPKI